MAQAMRPTYASVAVGITILALGVVGALAGFPVGVVVAILVIGAARLATAHSHAGAISPDASADLVAPYTERHHQAHTPTAVTAPRCTTAADTQRVMAAVTQGTEHRR
jgi:hypothetical protein